MHVAYNFKMFHSSTVWSTDKLMAYENMYLTIENNLGKLKVAYVMITNMMIGTNLGTQIDASVVHKLIKTNTLQRGK